MRKNDAGLTILEKGDVVRIGKGKVLYTVTLDELQTGFVNIESHNTGKKQVIARDRVSLVEAVQSVAYTAGASVEEIQENVSFDTYPPADKVRNMDQMREDLANGNPEFTKAEIEQNTRTQQGVSKAQAENRKEKTSYQKAVLLGLNRTGKHVYAGTVSETKKAKTRKLNSRQKASRKVNR